MNVHPLGGKPFHAGGEPEATALAGQGTQPVPQSGPRDSVFREAGIVVRLAVMHHQPAALPLLDAVVQVARHLGGLLVLEQFGVGPVHATLREQGLGDLPGTPQPLQEKDGLGVGLVDLRGDVLPRRQGHHVARIAAKAVHAALAPGEQGSGHHLPEGRTPMVQFHEILPGGPPGARTAEGAIRVPAEPFRPTLQEARPPARVVHEDIEQDLATPLMDSGCQFTKLILGGGFPVEVHQGGIDGREIQLGVRAAEAAHPGVGGGHGAHRQ